MEAEWQITKYVGFPVSTTQKKVTAEINLKLVYLRHGWKGAPGRQPVLRDKNLGTEDFRGRKYTISSHYIVAVGRGKKVNHLIDFENDIENRIERELKRLFNVKEI